MTDQIISEQDVAYVAKLARIALSNDEVEKVQKQLSRILEYISQLKAKDTTGIPPTSHPLELTNVWREDEPIPFEKVPELLKNAPELEESFYKVKKVIE